MDAQLQFPQFAAATADESRCARSYWRPIHYLGSKLRIAEEIRTLLGEVEPRQKPVCDLFAGSGTVAAALAMTREVTAVDIQEYSRVLCSALLHPNAGSAEPADTVIRKAESSAMYRDLLWAAEPLIEAEERSIELAHRGDVTLLCDLLDEKPLELDGNRAPRFRPLFRSATDRLTKLGLDTGPAAVVLRHFGGVYFSYRQAVQLAALLDCAHKTERPERDVLLAATLSTASEIVNTVGKQFAQPIRLRDQQGNPKRHLIRQVVRDRQMDAFQSFVTWLTRYRGSPLPKRSHRVFRDDFSNALSSHCDEIGVVYADPPYTRDHYSRFYHTLETMCLRDEPKVSFANQTKEAQPLRGIYRQDRHQSPFCIKSQAPGAFIRLFRGVKDLGVPLVLSYSPLPATTKPRPRVLEIDHLTALARDYFKQVDLVTVGRIQHNKFNNARHNSDVSNRAEVAVVCR